MGPTRVNRKLPNECFESGEEQIKGYGKVTQNMEIFSTKYGNNISEVGSPGDIIFQEEPVQDLCLWPSGLSYSHHCAEHRDTRSALSCWRRQGSPPSTLPRVTQEQDFFSFLCQTALLGSSWGLSWQTLLTVEESAGHLPGHPHCRERGWALLSISDLSSPIMHQLLGQKLLATPPAGQGCLAVGGGLRAGHQCDTPRVLQPIVSGSEEDAYLYVPMHQAVQKYLWFPPVFSAGS